MFIALGKFWNSLMIIFTVVDEISAAANDMAKTVHNYTSWAEQESSMFKDEEQIHRQERMDNLKLRIAQSAQDQAIA